MKDFGVGAVTIVAVGAGLSAFFLALAPLSSLNPDQGRAPAGVSMGIATYLAMGFVIVVVIGIFSSGVGAGVSDFLKRRKKE